MTRSCSVLASSARTHLLAEIAATLSCLGTLCAQKLRGPAGRSCTPWYASEPAGECETWRHQLPPPVEPSATYHLPGAAQQRGCCSACHLQKVATCTACTVQRGMQSHEAPDKHCRNWLPRACQAKQSAGKQVYLHLMQLGRPAAADLQQRPAELRMGVKHLKRPAQSAEQHRPCSAAGACLPAAAVAGGNIDRLWCGGVVQSCPALTGHISSALLPGRRRQCISAACRTEFSATWPMTVLPASAAL